MNYQCKCGLFFTLLVTLLIIPFCTDPEKPDFSIPDPLTITVFIDSLGTDTLHSGDTLLMSDTLFLGIGTNRPLDIISVTVNIADNSTGDTLYDTTTTDIDSSQLIIPIGCYIVQYCGTYTLSLHANTLDSTVNTSFTLIIMGASPEIGNNKKIQHSGLPIIDSLFFMYVTATGSDTLKYYWYKNDTLLTRASSDTLIFDTLTLLDSGVYHCKVVNDYDEDTSLKDTLSFYYPPNIIEMGTSGIPEKDSSFFLYVKATGSDTLEYQWFNNDTAVLVGIDDTLKFNTLTDSDNGNTYHCAVSNNAGSVTSDSYTIILGNHPPQWIHDTLFGTVDENATFSMSLSDSCTDPNNDVLTFSLLAGSPSGDTINSSNTYLFTPTFNDAGQYSVTISANDGNVSSKVLLILTVINVNRAPYFIPDTPFTYYQIDEGASLNITFKAVDPDGDPVTYQLAQNTVPRPQTVVFDTAQCIITWESKTNDLGAYLMELHAFDGSETGKVTIDIGVGNVNLPPQIAIKGLQSGQTIIIKEQTAFACSVTVTDPNIQDSPVLLPGKNAPPNSSYDIIDDTIGVFSYTPDFSVSNKLSDTTFSNVTFYATDSVTKAVDSFIVHITVKDSNETPQCSDVAKTVEEGIAEGINIPATDGDGDQLTWTIFEGPSKGITSSNSGNIDTGDEFSYTADNLISDDTDLILVKISDGLALCTASVNITVTADNDAPTADPAGPLQVKEDDQNGINFEITGTDPEGVNLQWEIITYPTNGTLSILQETLGAGFEGNYKPGTDFIGDDSFTFRINDGVNTSNEITVQVNVSGENDPPVVSGIPGEIILEGQNFATINLDNCVDDIDNLDNEITWNYSTTSQLAVNITSRIATISVPNADWNGSGSITFIAEDPGHLTGNDAATFTVTAVNDAPSFTISPSHTVLEDAGQTTAQGWATSISAGPSDESGQTLDFSCTNDNNALFSVQPTISHITGDLSYTPASNTNGSAIVTVTLQDDGGITNGGDDSETKQFNINVTAVNDPPIFTKGPNITVDEDPGASTEYNWATAISPGPSDENGQTLTFNITNNSNSSLFTSSGQPKINASGDLSYTPENNAHGSATITVTLSDDGGTANGGVNTSPGQLFTITVDPENDPPEITNINMSTNYAFADPMVITIQATFIDIDNAINQVSIKIDGGSPIACPTTNPLSYPWTVPWDEYTLGSHNVEITVKDASGLSDVETHNFSIDHNLTSDYKTVRHILDYNGQSGTIVDDVTNQSGGRITEFFPYDETRLELTELIKNLTALQKLDCFSSYIPFLPDELGQCTNLIEIKFGKAGIEDLPSSLSNLTSLTYFDISDNNSLSASAMNVICTITSLEDLNLYGCLLGYLPTSMRNLSNITKLGIPNNELTSLPFQGTDLPNLTKDNFFLMWNELCEPTSAWGLWLTAKFGSESEWLDTQSCK